MGFSKTSQARSLDERFKNGKTQNSDYLLPTLFRSLFKILSGFSTVVAYCKAK
jgi:hypothetical protein